MRRQRNNLRMLLWFKQRKGFRNERTTAPCELMHLFSDILCFYHEVLLTKRQGHHVSFHEQGILEDVRFVPFTRA
jgi:hypothetical protein